MMIVLRLILVIMISAGCGSDDSASFCVGTPIAGTCAQAFFQPASACFMESGQCTYEDHDTGSPTGKAYCWANGSHLYAYFAINGGQSGPAHAKWLSQIGGTCLVAETSKGATEDQP